MNSMNSMNSSHNSTTAKMANTEDHTDNVEKIIELLEKSECLWRVEIPEYLDRDKKRHATEEIAKSVEMSETMSKEEQPTLIRDIFYSGKDTDEDVDLADANKECLDLYLPAGVHFERCNDPENGPLRQSTTKTRPNPDQKVPFVIFVHGGGWRRGDRQVWQHFLSCWDTNILLAMVSWFYSWYSNVGECLADSGVACAVVSYPLVTINMGIIFWEKLSSFLGGVGVFSVLSGIVMFLCGSPSLKTVFWTGMLSYSVFIMVLMFIRTTWYRMNAGRRNLLWLMFGGVSFIIWAITDDYLYYISIFSTLYTQSILISKKIILPPVTHADQIKAVKSAIEWCNALCDKSDYFTDIILMGHSAGGHLVSLISLDPQNHYQRVKGVISISGVYDLQKLASGMLKYIYLHPVFGTDPSFWLAYSPRHIAKCQPDYKRPPYLLINADKDMHLIKDAKDLSDTFNEHNISHRLMVIHGKNHFTIMNLFNKSNKDHRFVKTCLGFIKTLDLEC